MLWRLLRGLALMVALVPSASGAQSFPTSLPVVTLDQERLFDGSRYGKALQRGLEAEAASLAAENRRIEAELEAEELELTARRPGLAPDEFRKLADAFDSKAEGTRRAQEAKLHALNRRGTELRQTFLDRARPILGQLMLDRGAVAVIAKNAVLLAIDSIDLTDAAIARLDAVLGDGSGPRIVPQGAAITGLGAPAVEAPEADATGEDAAQTVPPAVHQTPPDPVP